MALIVDGSSQGDTTWACDLGADSTADKRLPSVSDKIALGWQAPVDRIPALVFIPTLTTSLKTKDSKVRRALM